MPEKVKKPSFLNDTVLIIRMFISKLWEIRTINVSIKALTYFCIYFLGLPFYLIAIILNTISEYIFYALNWMGKKLPSNPFKHT